MISFISIEQSFDAWGRKRNPADWTYESIPATNLLYRGYTFHEHLDEFGLINMNGRAYDPIVGRFLNPDPVLQNPSDIQNYNRYSYCLNNPLKYTDPSGYRWSPIGDIHLHQLNLMANSMREAKMDLQDKIRFWTTGSSVSLIGVAKHEGPKGNNADGNKALTTAEVVGIIIQDVASNPVLKALLMNYITYGEDGSQESEIESNAESLHSVPTVTNTSQSWVYVLSEDNNSYQISAIPPGGYYYGPIDGLVTRGHEELVFKVPSGATVTVLDNNEVDMNYFGFVGDVFVSVGYRAGWKSRYNFNDWDLSKNGWNDLFIASQLY